MSLKQEIAKIDDDLLLRMFEFAAHAINDTKAVKNACEELELEKNEGMAFCKMIADLGITNETDVISQSDYDELSNLIKSSM